MMNKIKIWKNGKPSTTLKDVIGIFLMASGEINITLSDGTTKTYYKEDYDGFYII